MSSNSTLPHLKLFVMPAERKETVHDIVERVLGRHYNYLHDFCPNCAECMTCDPPHICASSQPIAKGRANAA